MAAECGLRVPKTLITNVPAEVRSFAEDLHGFSLIYKPLSSVRVRDEHDDAALYTSLVPLEDQDDPRIALTAHLFQEWIPKTHDVRLTVVRDDCFAVEIHTQQSAQAAVDWRADYATHSYRVTEVPHNVHEAVLGMLRRLGLMFGALDFAVTNEGDWVFLEINPNGQWGWLQDAVGLPISKAIADALADGHPSPSAT